MGAKVQKKENGSGTIYYVESQGRWKAEMRWLDSRGIMQRRTFSATKKSVVKNKLNEFKKQLLLSNGNISKGAITFEEFAENWLTTKQRNTLKPSSYMRKEVTLRNQVYPILGDIPIDQISHMDVQNMVNQLSDSGLSYSTVKKAYEAVNGCLREYRIVSRLPGIFNPCEGIALPENKERAASDIVFYDEEQRKKIIAEATRTYSNGQPVYRMGYAFVVLMFTGMRIGELLALTWDDVDFEKNTILVNKNMVVVKADEKDPTNYKMLNQKSTKTNAGRVLTINSATAVALHQLHLVTGKQKYVICTKQGKQIRPRNIERNFHNILKKAGLLEPGSGDCGVHPLRHTFASMLFQNGCDVKTVSELLGHSDTKVTENIYIHLIQEHKAMQMRDLDRFIS